MAAVGTARAAPGGAHVNGHHTGLSKANSRSGGSGAVRADMVYAKQPPEGEELFVIMRPPKYETEPRTNIGLDRHEVQLQDLRLASPSVSLHEHGFQLERLRVPEGVDWHNDQQVEEKCWPLVEELIKNLTGASRVFVFDRTFRAGSIKTGEEALAGKPGVGNGPLPRLHVDFTTKSGVDRLHAVLPDEAEKLSKTPFAVIQVWKPLQGPVKNAPLALMDAGSVASDDLMPIRLEFASRTGWNYVPKYNPDQKLYYAKDMEEDECWVFKCYDSRQGVTRFTPHSAFHEPGTAEDAAPRESVEIRAYAFWEHEAPRAIATAL